MNAPTVRQDLERRMRAPQRHRLLQGYPMVPLMPHVVDASRIAPPPMVPTRPMIVGVLPHPFCNPAVTGCGFCTFPHERFGNAAARAVALAVADEIDQVTSREPALSQRRVDAVYFGGGTANLTPPDAFAALCERLSARFDLGAAEVTLEGVPAYFLTRDGALLRALCEHIPAARRRVSMGVQTFDAAWLARMGRAAFGTREDIARVVETARGLGMTTSADLLINLPGQRAAQMFDDVRTAAAMGLDQICVYHLVLFEGLGTAWSNDRSLLAARPENARAAANWRAVRELLVELGYVQTTLTNFERAESLATGRGFVYERCSFRPEEYDALGFGPGAISCFSDMASRRALKWVNAEGSTEYLRAIGAGESARERAFEYNAEDLRLMYLTRKLSTLRVPREEYRALFGSDVASDYAGELESLCEASLVRVDEGAIVLTGDGAFYADSVAGLLASRRAGALRIANDAARMRMG